MEDIKEYEGEILETELTPEVPVEEASYHQDDEDVNIETDVNNICEKFEDLGSAFLSNEEKIEKINNTDTTGIYTNINQSEGLYKEDDPNMTQALNTPEEVEAKVVGTDTVYKDLPRPVMKDGSVDMDDYTNEEHFDGEPYGQKPEEGLGADMLNKMEVITEPEEIKDVYKSEDTYEGGEEMKEYYSKEEDEQEEIEIPEELQEKDSEDKEDDYEEETETTEPEDKEDEEEHYEDEDSEEIPEIEEGEEELDGDSDEVFTGTPDGEKVEGTISNPEVYGSQVVIEGLPDDLKAEIESIELVDNSNTKPFDGISFMKDKEIPTPEDSLREAEELADSVTDGVGLQESFDGTGVEPQGSADLVPGDSEEPETEVSYDEEVAPIEEQVATESMGLGASFGTNNLGTKYTTRNIMKSFWNK